VETTNINGNLILNGDMTEKALYNYMIDNGYDKKNILNYGQVNKILILILIINLCAH